MVSVKVLLISPRRQKYCARNILGSKDTCVQTYRDSEIPNGSGSSLDSERSSELSWNVPDVIKY